MINFQLLNELRVQKAVELEDLINEYNVPQKNVSGIYAIYCKSNHKVYFGKSKCVLSRLKDHRSSLLKNKHINKKLQRAFNKYGADNFIACLIQEVNSDLLTEAEGFYIKYFNTVKTGFNARREDL